jgi:hypothetical protein
MKKAFSLLLVTFLMVGCGGAGTTAPTTSGIPGGDTGGGGAITSPVGYITVEFQPSAPSPSAPVGITQNGSLAGLEKGFRVAVSRTVTTSTPSLDEEGNPINTITTTRTFFSAKDNTVPGNVTIAAPVDTGYVI